MNGFCRFFLFGLWASFLLVSCNDDKKIEELRTLYNTVRGEYQGKLNEQAEHVVVNYDEGGLFLTFQNWSDRRFFLKKIDTQVDIYEFRGTDAFESYILLCHFTPSLRQLEITEERQHIKFVGKK